MGEGTSVQNIQALIHKVLQHDDRLWNEDKTELNQTLLLDLVEKTDETIITLLLQQKELKEKFFTHIQEIYVFKTNDFRLFMEQHKVDNSYTAYYKNRIGLSDGKRFLKDTNDIVLDFPYKDCVLEGGQSSEEGTDTYFAYEEEKTKTIDGNTTTEPAGYKEKTATRKEIFFNQVLAHDEIDRLFDHKALTHWKRITKDGEQAVQAIQRNEHGTIKENLIIKGNNLLALHSLKKQFAGKVKLIYIDPPYNTGNDGFKYNDKFNHSTWLVFMKNRLEAARELLRDDGVIFVQCDDNEQAYLKVLMDEVFGRENFVNTIVWRRKGGKTSPDAKKLENSTDYIHMYKIKDVFNMKFIFTKTNSEKYIKEQFKYIDDDGRSYRISPLNAPQPRPTLQYNFMGYKPHPNGWSVKKETLQKFYDENKLVFPKNKDGRVNRKQYLDEWDGYAINSLWDDIALIAASSFERVNFDRGQKPEALLQRIIELSTKPNDIVLDYHLGSGTTCAVAHKMGRQYIGIEQMDYIEPIAVERLKKVLDGEQGGISKTVNWQGGGDFVYCELVKWNETAKETINDCASLEELEHFFDTMYERYFLNYNLKIKEFKDKVLTEKNFRTLNLDEQKHIFLTMLDLNQMYVNLTEMADAKYNISKQDQMLTEKFYKEE